MVAVDEFENSRTNERRSQPDLVLTRQDREELLLEWGASFHEIIDAIRTNVRVKNQRRRTVNSIGTYDRWEEVMESAGRKIKRTLLMQKAASPVKSVQKPERRPSGDQQRRNQYEQQKEPASPTTPPKTTPSATAKLAPSNELKNAQAPLRQTPPQAKTENRQTGDHPDPETDNMQQRVIFPRLHEHDTEEKSSSSQNIPAPLVQIVECDMSSMASGSEFDDFADLVSDEFSCSHASGQQNPSAPDYHRCQPAPHVLLYNSGRTERSDDSFENLQRDDSFWELRQGETDSGPLIQRRMTPVIITEDYSMPTVAVGALESNAWCDAGFLIQPPPYSSAMISKWE